MYRHPAVRPPSVKQLSELAGNLGFDASDTELEQYKASITKLLAPYNRLEQLAEPTLPVKYPRTPGHAPKPEDNKYNAWYWQCDIQGAETGKLAGKKVVIKDNVPVAGVPMMNGSSVMEGYIAEYDPTAVTRILDEGGNIVGKGTTENLCISGNSFTSAKGPILNPHDPSRASGGSTSGCAVLLATNEVDLALGVDQGGSIRIPSSWCGIVGMKPSFGLIPYTGVMSMEGTLDYMGPMARTTKDAALMLEVLAGLDDGLDPRQPADLKVPKYSELCLSGDLTGVRVGLVTEVFAGCEQDVDQTVRAAAQSMTSKGAVVQEVSIPMHNDGPVILFPIFLQGVYYDMYRDTGTGTGFKGFYPTSLADSLFQSYKTRANDMSASFKTLLLHSSYIKEFYGLHFYAKAQNLARTLTKAYDEALEKYDVLVMPTIKTKAPKVPPPGISIGEYMDQALGMAGNTGSFNATGHPALTTNAGFSEGLPVGMQIIGKNYDDATVLRVAHAFEMIRDAKI